MPCSEVVHYCVEYFGTHVDLQAEVIGTCQTRVLVRVHEAEPSENQDAGVL